MYDWLSTVNDKFWLILNYSKVVWDIDTKFSPVVVLMSFQLSTKFEGHNSLKKTAMPLGSSKWKWAWRAHFLSHTYETQKICCFLADVQIILVSFFDIPNQKTVIWKRLNFLLYDRPPLVWFHQNYTKGGLSRSRKITLFQITGFWLGISKNGTNIIWRSIWNTYFSKVS